MILPFLGRAKIGAVKPPVYPGSQSYGYGTYSPVIPEYNTITMEIWGAGGGSATCSPGPGSVATAGGTSYFTAPSGTIYAYGGGPGQPGDGETAGAYGPAGGASGGDANVAGGGNPGGQWAYWNSYVGGHGGEGGYVRKTWTWGQPGAPVVGSAYSLVCAGGGAGGYYSVNTALNGYAGSNASARLTWS